MLRGPLLEAPQSREGWEAARGRARGLHGEVVNHDEADELRQADDEAGDPPVGIAEQCRQGAQLRPPIYHGQMLEHQQKRHRAHQPHEMLGHPHPAPGEALHYQRSRGADHECAEGPGQDEGKVVHVGERCRQLRLGVAKPLGLYMARVFERETTWFDRLARPVERLIYRLTGIDETHEMRWTEYAVAMLLFSLVTMVVTYAIERLQHIVGWFDKWLMGMPKPEYEVAQ